MRTDICLLYTAISRKVVGKSVHATIPKGSMGYEQYAVPDTVAVEPTLLLSFSTLKHMSMASRAILSNFFERTVNSKPPTISFGIVACTFSDNLSRNSCRLFPHHAPVRARTMTWDRGLWARPNKSLFLINPSQKLVPPVHPETTETVYKSVHLKKDVFFSDSVFGVFT